MLGLVVWLLSGLFRHISTIDCLVVFASRRLASNMRVEVPDPCLRLLARLHSPTPVEAMPCQRLALQIYCAIDAASIPDWVGGLAGYSHRFTVQFGLG
jgi:hypothetical protein